MKLHYQRSISYKMKYILLICFCLTIWNSQAQVYKTSNGKVDFFSHTPVEDIQARSEKISAVINIATNQVAFSMLNTSFQFPNSLMQAHFNEKYMESEKFPKSTFSGKIIENINFKTNGEHKVTINGKLQVHGVEKDRTIPAYISIKDGKITATSDFTIKTEDHKIEIPKLVWEKIAEEIKVSINTVFLVQ